MKISSHRRFTSFSRCALLLLTALAGSAAHGAIPIYDVVVKNVYPHDAGAFTQGLFFSNGYLYESTGLQGRSSLRKVELKTGKVVMKTDISSEYFAEGITEVKDDIVGLTWTSQVGFVFDKATLKMKQTFSYAGEGWGLAHDGKHVLMSDGTAFIRTLKPGSLEEISRVQVTADGKPLERLNELEWVDGELYANVWGADVIARIDATSGKVIGWIDLSGLLKPEWRAAQPVDVLNGIAYDKQQRKLYVTGKLWPKLFEVALVKRK